jgi:predicted RNase H-like nuclease (RuvC/YqgF family)
MCSKIARIYDKSETKVVEVTGTPPEVTAVLSVAKAIERPDRNPYRSLEETASVAALCGEQHVTVHPETIVKAVVATLRGRPRNLTVHL